MRAGLNESRLEAGGRAVFPGRLALCSRASWRSIAAAMPGNRLDTRAFVPFHPAEIEDSLPGRFARQVRAHSGRLAVKYGEEALTYEALDQRANRIANAVLARCGDRGRPVALLIEQGVSLVASILGVLKAGNLYVPLDPTHPVPRLLEALEEAEPAALLADAHNLALARGLAREDRPALDVAALAHGFSDQDPALPIAPESLAYIFFTSGSTGRPKGVVDCHRNVLHNIMRYTNNLRIGADDRLTLLQSATFSGTVSSLFGALLNGAAVLPYDLRRQGLGVPLADWIRREQVTVYHSVPTIFRSFLEGGARFPDVRVVRLEGDTATPADVDLYRRHFPAAVLAVGLGATETGLSCQLVVDGDEPAIEGVVPIGFPAADLRVHVRDEAGQPLPPGRVGELMVSSPYLAVGYWKRPDLTAAAFTPDPEGGRERTYGTGDLARIRPDGCVEYLGRKDHRLKVHGQTVEAADVEAALLRMGFIREAAVTTHEDAAGESRLVAYVVPAANPAWNASEARAILARSVPAYMVPHAFVLRSKLPVTATGKLDRASLGPPTPRTSTRPHVRRGARDELETTLVDVWEKTLGVPDVGIDEDFVDLGGDSLLATRATAAIDRRVGRRVPADAILAHGTVEALARAIREGQGWPHGSAVVPLRAQGRRRPFFFLSTPFGGPQRFEPLARRLGPEQPFYSVWPLDRTDFETEDLRFESLAARRIQDLARIQPHGPYLLGGTCYGAVVAFEMARQLRAAGEDVALLVLCQITVFDFPSLVSPLARWRHRFHQVVGGRIAHLAARFSHHRRRSLAHPEGRVRYFADLAQRLRLRLVARTREASPATGETATAGGPRRVEEEAFRAYVPRPYPGPVVLVLSDPETRPYARDASSAWKGLAGGPVVVHVMGGRPSALFDEPEVADVGRILGRELRRVEEVVGRRARDH